MNDKPIIIPERYNYIAVFLTFNCNLACSYCINYFGESKFKREHLSGQDWVKGLNRIVSRDNLPVTLQGGEPSLHPDFIYIINHLKPGLNIDILTNLQFDLEKFIREVKPERIKRNAPYASIRVSYHPEQMVLDDTINRTLKLLEAGFSVGIWGVIHPFWEEHILEAKEKATKLGIDFRTKEFLGEYQGKLYGTYKYQGACEKKFTQRVKCRTTELIIGSAGDIYRCHSDLYEGRQPISHILNPGFQVEDIYRDCNYFGHCNPCDVKVKTNRFQVFGHTSVEIKF
ncbi:MAG TPA: radical SAM protein [Elusimicrobia bacterium]|jgi:MoaA/NifB/PqqE/SkfB family radical SAM enzyme|nr:radical SAM protein [Elusimicrobiota bacterium]